MSKKPIRENQWQHAAFLAYCNMPEPSVEKLYLNWSKLVPNFKKPKLRTLKDWRRRYQWVARFEEIHQEAKRKAEEKEVEKLAMKKKEVLKTTRMIMFLFQHKLKIFKKFLKKGKLPKDIDTQDFVEAWRIDRIERGQPTDIGKHEMEVKDEYSNLSDEELIERLEKTISRYKEKLKKNETDNR